MSTLSVRLSNSLHRQLKLVAERDGISMNQFIATAIAEKLTALTTAEYLQQRAEHGDYDRFAKALAKVPDIEPEDQDKL